MHSSDSMTVIYEPINCKPYRMDIVPLRYSRDGFTLPLLKRPRPLPAQSTQRQGIYAEWKVKGAIFRDSGKLPRLTVKVTVRVQYASLIVEGKFPRITITIPLVNIAFVECSGLDFLDVRGRTLRLMLCGTDHDIKQMTDDLRYLVVRQRVPHALMGKTFDWKDEEVREDQKKVVPVSKWSFLNCFLVF